MALDGRGGRQWRLGSASVRGVDVWGFSEREEGQTDGNLLTFIIIYTIMNILGAGAENWGITG